MCDFPEHAQLGLNAGAKAGIAVGVVVRVVSVTILLVYFWILRILRKN
jgi:tetrahydromethanopterin S-methyltransferase subunit F